jgi:hypothetical protein
MSRLGWPGVLGFCSLVGCTDVSLQDPAATEQAAIVNGTISSPVDDAVVGVFGGGSGCTGALIAPTVVLTALHCVVADFDTRFRFTCQPDGTLTPGSTAGTLGDPIDPSLVSVGVGVSLGSERVRAKAIYGSGSTDACHDDIAVLVLESAPDIGDAPLVSLRFSPTTHKGERTRIVGYGDVEQTQTQRGRQVRTDLPVRGVGGPDADTPGDPLILPRTIQVGEGSCHGDSGGPLFSQETGAEVGVYSLLNTSTCTGLDVRNTYTNIAYFEPLIRMALESEGVEPLLEREGPSGAGGEAGTPSTSGGSDAVGGTESNGSGGSSATEPGAAGAPTAPDDFKGSGSYHDSSCSCRAVGKSTRAPWLGVSACLLLGVGLAARRRARQRQA